MACIASGKGVRTSEERRNGSNSAAIGSRRPSYNRQVSATASPTRNLAPPAPNLDTKPRIGDYLSTSPSSSHQNYSSRITSPSPGASDYPSPAITPGRHTSPGPRGGGGDYFSSRERQPSSSNQTATPGIGGIGSAVAVAAKKKPPPPPPPRAASSTRAMYVTALYDFGGQGDGDLVFREGDRIRVIKKTESTDEWWEGELRGVKGSFPANYCR